jgi:uncharacterized protein (DUF1778 family)
VNEEIIQFAVTAEEKALIEEMAKSDDRTVSDYVHHTVIKHTQYEKDTLKMFEPPAILRKAWQEFKKLGE